MAWAFQSITAVGTQSTNSTTITATLPATYSSGSLLVLFVAHDTSSTATSTQSYTNIVSNGAVSGLLFAAVWHKIATSGSETAPTLTFVSSVKAQYFMVAYSDVASFDAVSTLATTSCPTGTTNCTTGTLTTTASNDLILSFFAGLGGPGGGSPTLTYGTPAGMTSRLNQASIGPTVVNTQAALLLADKNQIATGTSTADTSAAVKVGASTTTSGQYQIAFKQKQSNGNFFFLMG